jgi:ribonucrease Y
MPPAIALHPIYMLSYILIGFVLGAVLMLIYYKFWSKKLTDLESQLQIKEKNLKEELSEKLLKAERNLEESEHKLQTTNWLYVEIETKNKLAEAQKLESDKIIKAAEFRAKEIQEFANKESDRIMSRLDTMQIKLDEKEVKIEQNLEKIESQKEYLEKKEKELDSQVNIRVDKIQSVSNMTKDQAKEELMDLIKNEYSADFWRYIDKLKWELNQQAEKEAVNIISKIIPRVATNNTAEFTQIMVDIPSEDMKGKIIWREGRNVAVFERVTGVELIVDHDKRRIAKELLIKLVKDWRINPFYIEKTYQEIVENFDNMLIEKGKEALIELNLPMQHPDIVNLIGKFNLRYSYGQNLWIHSVEVAKMSELIANELWLDGMLAKKAWLLHDIGKIDVEQWWSHTKVWWEILRKYGYDEVTIETAEWHHHDIVMTNPIWRVVAAADAISASRPWARLNNKDFFIKKMTELENLIMEVPGINKTYIMQAGREIMVFVNPDMIDDLGTAKLLKDIAIKVENSLDYPGIIRVVWIRETKVIDYLR